MDKSKNRRSFGNKHKDFSSSDFYRNNSWRKHRTNDGARYEKQEKQDKQDKQEKEEINLKEEYKNLISSSFSWKKNLYNI